MNKISTFQLPDYIMQILDNFEFVQQFLIMTLKMSFTKTRPVRAELIYVEQS